MISCVSCTVRWFDVVVKSSSTQVDSVIFVRFVFNDHIYRLQLVVVVRFTSCNVNGLAMWMGVYGVSHFFLSWNSTVFLIVGQCMVFSKPTKYRAILCYEMHQQGTSASWPLPHVCLCCEIVDRIDRLCRGHSLIFITCCKATTWTQRAVYAGVNSPACIYSARSPTRI